MYKRAGLEADAGFQFVMQNASFEERWSRTGEKPSGGVFPTEADIEREFEDKINALQPKVMEEEVPPERMDENNVKVEEEIATMIKNHIYYSKLVGSVSGHLRTLKYVIDAK